MRMAGPDIVLFVIGALLFGGASYAIVTSPGGLGGAGSPLGLFTVQFQAKTVQVDSKAVATLRSATEEFTVTQMNVSAVNVAVACSGPASNVGPLAFSLAVDVKGPGSFAGSGTGSCTAATKVDVKITSLPADGSAQGSTSAEAEKNVPVQDNATLAQGKWTVTVTGSRGGPALPGNPSDPGGTITLNIMQWTPRLTPVSR